MTSIPGAVVLAGGRSRRMGLDKPALRIDDERLVDRVVGRLGPGVDRIVVAAGPDRRLTPPGAEEVSDAGRGPLDGIVAGLAHLAVDGSVAVVAADAPFVSLPLLRRLAEVRDGLDAAVPVVDGVLQPLHAVWRGGLAEELARDLDAGERSPSAVLATREIRRVDRDEWQVHDPDGRFAVSWNTPTDVAVSGRLREG